MSSARALPVTRLITSSRRVTTSIGRSTGFRRQHNQGLDGAIREVPPNTFQVIFGAVRRVRR
jgi:hypothetical protein